MIPRRDFLACTAGTLSALALTPSALARTRQRVEARLACQPDSSPVALAGDEAFWAEILTARALYPGPARDAQCLHLSRELERLVAVTRG